MKIATWNVNSLKVRLPHVLEWLAAHDPDAGTSRTAYNDAGLVESTLDARGVQLSFEYDVLDIAQAMLWAS